MIYQKSYLLLTALGLSAFISQSRAEVAIDNSRINKRDKSVIEVTADNQSFDKKDVALTRQIRRRIMSEKNMSTYGQNVKIITSNGLVTLKGPVMSAKEHRKILVDAKSVAGAANVIDQLEVTSSQE